MSSISYRGHSCVAASPFAQQTFPQAQPRWKHRQFIGDPCLALGSWQQWWPGALVPAQPHGGQAPDSAPHFPHKPPNPGLINHQQINCMAAAGTAASPSLLLTPARLGLVPGVVLPFRGHLGAYPAPGVAAAEIQLLERGSHYERGLNRRGGVLRGQRS